MLTPDKFRLAPPPLGNLLTVNILKRLQDFPKPNERQLITFADGKLSKKTQQIISDFSKFELYYPSSHYQYNKTDDNISIRCNRTTFMTITYLLNISKYWINGSNANFEVKFDYNFDASMAILRFSFASAYDFSGEPVGVWFDEKLLGYADLREDDCRVATDYIGYHAKYKEHNLGLKNSAILFLKKNAGSMKCGVKDCDGKTILSRTWRSSEYYIPLNYVRITFMSRNAGNEVNITSIGGEITLQDRNWQVMLILYPLVKGVIIVAVIVLIVFGLYKFVNHYKKLEKIKRKKFYEKLNEYEHSNK